MKTCNLNLFLINYELNIDISVKYVIMNRYYWLKRIIYKYLRKY